MKKIKNLSVSGELAMQIEIKLKYSIVAAPNGLAAIGNVRKSGNGYLVTYQSGNLERCAFFKRDGINGAMNLKWAMICD